MPTAVGIIGLANMGRPMALTKHQELETAFAKQLGVPLLLANVSQQVYQMARAAGLGKEDGIAIIKVLERLAGVQVG